MLQKSSMWSVASLFFIYPTKQWSLVELSRQARVAHTSVKRNLEQLAKEQIITVKQELKHTRIFPVYSAKQESKQYTHYKHLYNLNQVYLSSIISYLEKTCAPTCIVLFGSYADGQDDEHSDIDIYVQSEKQKISYKKFERFLKRPIQIHFGQFRNLSDTLQQSVINGTVLSGFLEVPCERQ